MPACARKCGCMFQNHHILLQHFRDHPVVSFLADRFNPDAVRNRMFLPSSQGVATDLTSSPHTGGHLGAYFEGFREYLEGVQKSRSYAAALAGNTRELDEVASDMKALVAAAKYALANGHLFANTPARMTSKEANAVNQKWFEDWRKYAADNYAQIQEMLETVDQFSNAGQPEGGLYFPLLSPTSDLGMAERIEIFKRISKRGSPISLQFTAVGPVPGLPGLVPSFVATRLPGFIPHPPEGVNESEGFTPSNPLLTHGLPGFPVPSAEWERAMQLPPTTATPSDPFVLKSDPMTGVALPFYENPLAGNSANNSTLAQDALPWLAGAAALGVAGPFIPAWLAMLGLGAGVAVGVGAAGAQDAKSVGAEGAEADGRGVFSAGAAPYNHFGLSHTSDNVRNTGADSASSMLGLPLAGHYPLDPDVAGASTFADRFGNWADTSAGTVPARPSNLPEESVTPPAGAIAPEEVRRLTRVNESNAGSVFTSGSAPVPYLPSTEFNDRFGNWTMPTADRRRPEPSRPIGPFAPEPSYFIPPPIFGVDGAGSPHNDAEEWYARWIRPLIRPE